jgi:hypothetical protein
MGVELAVDAFDVFVDRAGRQYEAPGDALGAQTVVEEVENEVLAGDQ